MVTNERPEGRGGRYAFPDAVAVAVDVAIAVAAASLALVFAARHQHLIPRDVLVGWASEGVKWSSNDVMVR